MGMNRLDKWLKQRRREKKLSMKYASQALHIQDVELNLASADLALIREMFIREAEFQKRKGVRDYVK
jgi:hypothetical protein